MRTVGLAVATFFALALVGLGGFFLGRYVLDSEADLRVRELQSDLAQLEQQRSYLETSADDSSAAYQELVDEILGVCSELETTYPRSRWTSRERTLCQGF